MCFIISIFMCGGLVAQNNNTKAVKSKEIPPAIIEPDAINNREWTNSDHPFAGVWSLEKVITNDLGDRQIVYPGICMVVHPDATYNIFAFTNGGGVITSTGEIILESPTVYVEKVISQMNSSLIGMTVKIDYVLENDYLIKSFRYEEYGDDPNYRKLENETWKRMRKPSETYL